MSTSKSQYSGPDRRRHKVYVTQNHEYHCKDGICVAIRDVRSGEFLPDHPAVGKTLTGALVLKDGTIESISPPEDAAPGHRMYFAVNTEDPNDVLTSSLKSIERPSLETVATYKQ